MQDPFFTEISDNDDLTMKDLEDFLSQYSNPKKEAYSLLLDVLNGYYMPHLLFNDIISNVNYRKEV